MTALRFRAAATKPTTACPECGGWITCTTTRVTSDGRWRTRYYSCRSCGYSPHVKRVLRVSRKPALRPATAAEILARVEATMQRLDQQERER